LEQHELQTEERDTDFHALLLINSLEQSHSSEANSRSASQEIPLLLLNPTVHYLKALYDLLANATAFDATQSLQTVRDQ
jgi:hypothetical protein